MSTEPEPHSDPNDPQATSGFAELLRQHRIATGTSQHALARAAGIDASYLHRLERGDREPPKLEVATALADALGLEPADRDRLLVAAGHLPTAIATLGPLDPTLLTVAATLADPSMADADRLALRLALGTLCAHWRRA